MVTVLTCITREHDFKLLALAALVCITGSRIGIKTFALARNETIATTRSNWLLVSSVAVGAAIWATHFLAMLAYRPGLETGWNQTLTILSLLVAGLFTAAGLHLGANRAFTFAPETGGAILGLGIGAMHFLGMRAFEVAGHLGFDAARVVVALVIGSAFGALSLGRAARASGRLGQYAAVGALILAICGLHFTAMSAIAIVPDPSVVIEKSAIPDAAVGYGVAAMTLLMIAMTFVTYRLEMSSVAVATARLRKLANATMEGILVTREGRVVDANDSFLRLVGMDIVVVRGLRVGSLWAAGADPGQRVADFETELLAASGELVPIRVLGGEATDGERIYAIRDLRAKRVDEATILHMAHHDALTGLVNRARFVAAVEQAVAAGAPFAVVYVDVVRLKAVNEAHGRAIGDAALVETAHRLERIMPGCLAARLGGDEFAVLKPLATVDGDDDGDRLDAALREPLFATGAVVEMAAAIGIVRYPLDGGDAAELLANAEVAARVVKSERASGCRRFESALRDQIQRRRALSRDLTAAVDDGSLALVYQVQQSVNAGETIGFEALLRWTHPVHGAISPVEFIPLAEENGAIVPIGAWVTRRACRDAMTWPAHVKVAVNLSPAQLRDDLDAILLASLVESGLPPSRLEVEITESLLIENPAYVQTLLRRIKALGVSIALDDFGTGFSSLSMLQAFPFDKIKIDRSFVENLTVNPQAAAIVRAVVNLGKSLDIPVLAEGVEHQAHLDFLKEQGCASAQGYLLGKPTPLAGTRAFFEPCALEEPGAISAAA